MTNFGVYINPELKDKESIFELISCLQEEHGSHSVQNAGIHFYGDSGQKAFLPEYIQVLDIDSHKGFPSIDCILVFGGDGTILKAKEMALRTQAPILGINLGYLGFLSESTVTEIRSSIQDLVSGKYRVLKRMLISCHVKRNGKVVSKTEALNDAVIYKGDNPGLIRVRIFAGARYVFDTRCDGVITSTPTGSTAYSLASGGPILAPQMKAMVLCPLNPHLLTIRPMVFPAEEKLCLRVHGLSREAWLQIDGTNVLALEEGDEVHITASAHFVNFIKLSKRTFYRILRNKLHLGK